MKFRSKKLILIIVALILFGGFFFIRLDKNKKSLPGLDLKKAQTAEVKKGNLEKYLIFAGKIDAQNFAVLHFQTSGQLAWLGVKEGDRVNKWQAVASLDKESLKKTLQKEMNDYLTSRWNFEDTQDQYKETKERKLITEEIKRIKSTEKEARKFGIQVGLVFMIITLILFISDKGNSHYFFIVGGVLIILGQLFPQLLIIPNKLWMSLGVVLGYFSSRIILFVLFYFILTPIGIAAKIFGKNFFFYLLKEFLNKFSFSI